MIPLARRSPISRLCFSIGLLPLLGLVLWLTWNTTRNKPKELVYDGKTLSELLYPIGRDVIWIPNDVYGHIHDELWYKLTSPPNGETNENRGANWTVTAFPGIGTNAIPFLIQWMRIQPKAQDRFLDRLAEQLPSKLRALVAPYSHSGWNSRAGRCHIAAFAGFSSLGTNAAPALPALSNLLHGVEADLQLTWAIANIGPGGIALLTNFLTRTKANVRDEAALALGLQFEKARLALPALVACVQRGQAGYDVLGAIGRIGGTHPQLVPALLRLLRSTPVPSGVDFDEDMAILVLGLQGAAAAPALPALLARYRALPETEMVPQRRLLRRAIKSISPEAETQLPPPTRDELWTWWP